jgi:hypothetical protein
MEAGGCDCAATAIDAGLGVGAWTCEVVMATCSETVIVRELVHDETFSNFASTLNQGCAAATPDTLRRSTPQT